MGVTSTTSAGSAQESAEHCAAHWVQALEQWRESQQAGGYEALLAQWRSRADSYQGTGVYELRLAGIHLMLDQFEQARSVLAESDIPPQYAAEAEAVRIRIEFLSCLSSAEPEQAALEQLEARVARFVADHPAQHRETLGHLRILLGRYDAAIEPLQQVLQHEAQPHLGVYRNLTLAYAHSARYAEAAAMMDEAYALSEGVVFDEHFAYAAAWTFAALGEPGTAKDMLTVVLNHKPQLQHDSGFHAAVARAQELSGARMK